MQIQLEVCAIRDGLQDLIRTDRHGFCFKPGSPQGGLSMNEQEYAKALAKKKRIIAEVAGQIHDVVEDTLWSNYAELPALAARIQELMADLEQFKRDNPA